MSDFWDREEVFGEFPVSKNGDIKVVVSKATKSGRDHINIRRWYQDENGEFRPTSKGLTIPFKDLEQLQEILQAMR